MSKPVDIVERLKDVQQKARQIVDSVDRTLRVQCQDAYLKDQIVKKKLLRAGYSADSILLALESVRREFTESQSLFMKAKSPLRTAHKTYRKRENVIIASPYQVDGHPNEQEIKEIIENSKVTTTNSNINFVMVRPARFQ